MHTILLFLGLVSANPSPVYVEHRPDRGDALNCIVNDELRRMDPSSPYLPENGYHFRGEWTKCPSPTSPPLGNKP